MASDALFQATQENFDAEVLESDLPVLIDFWATWCGPCKAIAPMVEEMARKYEGRLKVGKLNVDEAPRIAMRYGVRSIPTLLLFKDGKVADQRVGAIRRDRLEEFVENQI